MRRVLTFRTDAIGDAILWAGATEALHRVFPDARHAVVCRHASSPIFDTCPFIDDVITVDPHAISTDEGASQDAIGRLNAWCPGIVLNPIRSRERVCESLVGAVEAPVRIALESDTANASPQERTEFDANYTRIIPSPTLGAHELERHADFLGALGGPQTALWPRVWLTDHDRSHAQQLFDDLGVAPEQTMAVFPAARWRYKLFPAWPRVLSSVLEDQQHIDAVLIMGGEDAVGSALPIAEAIARSAPRIRVFERCAGTTLREAIAIIERCRICVGNDTFAIHAAGAVGVPSVAVAGGGHFGRFLPYDPRGVVAYRPLACAGCDWHCSFDHAHCIQDVPPHVVIAAVRVALSEMSDRPRIFVPAGVSGIECGPGPGEIPAWVLERADVVEVPADMQRSASPLSVVAVPATRSDRP